MLPFQLKQNIYIYMYVHTSVSTVRNLVGSPIINNDGD